MSISGVAACRHHDVRSTDDRRLRVYETGDPQGEVVLVHHGTPGCGLLPSEWADDAMNRGIRLIGYDRPGYAGSDPHRGRQVADAATDAATIADALQIPRFRTIGGSGGGPHALACAALLSERVIAAAIVASGAPYDAAGLDWMAGMGQDNINEYESVLAGEAELTLHLTKARDEITAAGADRMTSLLQSLLPPVDAAALTSKWGGFAYHNMSHGISPGIEGWVEDDFAFLRPWGFDPRHITVPVRLVHGRQDRVVPFGHGEWLAHHIPNVVADLLNDEGHISVLNQVPALHAWLLEQ
jgi:pimeloyl-ACP methyl ester carboxylesterase